MRLWKARLENGYPDIAEKLEKQGKQYEKEMAKFHEEGEMNVISVLKARK